MRAMKSVLALFALAFAALASGAVDTGGEYRVEVIVLRANSVPSGEDLSQPAEGRGFEGRYTAAGTQPTVLRQLTGDALQMNGLAARLARSGGWQVLAHAGWVQTASVWPRHAGVSLADAGINVPDLSGTFYVESGQLLHFGMRLTLGSTQPWSMAELRVIKFNEKNYFDHPGLGVIALVSRVGK